MVLVRMVPVLVHARKRTFSMTKTTITKSQNHKSKDQKPNLNHNFKGFKLTEIAKSLMAPHITACQCTE